MNDNSSRRDILAAVAPAAVLAGAVAVTASPGRAATITQSLTTAINSYVSGVGGFVGTLTLPLNSFSVVNNILTATVNLVGTVLGPTGTALGTIGSATQPFQVQVPVQVSGSCQILSLTLGPLHLNLLGLVIDLNQVVLTITAVPGAGNLLGNLLCQVAGLLNGGGTVSNFLTQLTTLLNGILAVL